MSICKGKRSSKFCVVGLVDDNIDWSGAVGVVIGEDIELGKPKGMLPSEDFEPFNYCPECGRSLAHLWGGRV